MPKIRERRAFLGYDEEVKKRAFEKWKDPLLMIEQKKARLKIEGRKIGKRDLDRIKLYPFNAPSNVFVHTANQTAEQVQTAAKMIKHSSEKIVVNNIGCGCDLKDFGDRYHAGTYEPFFIANGLEQLGKKYEVRAFALNPKEIEIARQQRSIRYGQMDIGVADASEFVQFGKVREYKTKLGFQNFWMKIPKKILNNVKFNQLDIITETPAKQADITTIRGVPAVDFPMFATDMNGMTMLKNAVDSTKKNGYIIFTTKSDERKQICKLLGLKYIQGEIYQKK